MSLLSKGERRRFRNLGRDCYYRCHDVQRGSSLERVDQLIDALRAGAEQDMRRRQSRAATAESGVCEPSLKAAAAPARRAATAEAIQSEAWVQQGVASSLTAKPKRKT